MKNYNYVINAKLTGMEITTKTNDIEIVVKTVVDYFKKDIEFDLTDGFTGEAYAINDKHSQYLTKEWMLLLRAWVAEQVWGL
jgi:hypothetical protein